MYCTTFHMSHNITEKPTRFVRADKLSTVLEWTKGINNDKTSVGLALDCKKKNAFTLRYLSGPLLESGLVQGKFRFTLSKLG